MPSLENDTTNRFYRAEAAGPSLSVIGPQDRPNKTALKRNRQLDKGHAIDSLHISNFMAHKALHQVIGNVFQTFLFIAKQICLPLQHPDSSRR
jgi:hypothetical protein